MKKIISVLMVAAALMMAAPAHAQIIKFGVKGGMSLSKMSFSESDWKGDNKTGWFIGPMAEFTLPIVGLGVDAAALYSQTDLAVKGEENHTLKSIDIPVNLKWSFGLGSIAGIYVAAGPQFGFNLDDKWEGFDMKQASTSLNLGAGVKLIKHLQIGLNYNLALSDMATIKDENSGKEIGIKNNSWKVSLAYIF